MRGMGCWGWGAGCCSLTFNSDASAWAMDLLQQGLHSALSSDRQLSRSGSRGPGTGQDRANFPSVE